MLIGNQAVIAVANRKGGTGKTTTAVNLSAEWASRGIRTLFVDLDSQGHAGIGLGFNPLCQYIVRQLPAGNSCMAEELKK